MIFLGAECSIAAKLLRHCLEITADDITAALSAKSKPKAKPISKRAKSAKAKAKDAEQQEKKQELVNGILEKVAQLKILWSLLSKITVAAEQPSFDGASLNSLEGLTIDFNIFWRNTFGMLFLVCISPAYTRP